MTRKRVPPIQIPRPQPATPLLTRHWRAVLAMLFVLGLGWRLAYLGRLAATPVAGSLRADERDYWDWAGFLLGHGFRGTNAFFLGPLYPHVLALMRAVLGSNAQNVLAVQAVWGAAATVLLTDAARRLTRPPIALVIGIVLAFYEMCVFYDGLVLMESLLFFLEALLLWMWCDASNRGSGTARFVAIALVTGVIAQGRPYLGDAEVQSPLEIDKRLAAPYRFPQFIAGDHVTGLHKEATKHLRRLRLERASGLLRLTPNRVSEIAEQCGFNSIYSFSRAFHAAFGQPPVAYRQSVGPRGGPRRKAKRRGRRRL